MDAMVARRTDAQRGIGYRADIDGLRAVAVLPVVFFHLGVGWFSGGYVGVDVFFVISGFLITGAIAREIEDRSFSLVGFYERRARRILPALFATMLAVTIAGLVLFMPDELRDTGLSMVGVSTFSSNIFFWKQVDYFNGAVELKPLIHTWSLAVEEQFYILFPLLLAGIERVTPRRHRLPVLALLLASFVLSVVLLGGSAEADYYLLPSRAWELMVGSAVALGYVAPIRQRVLAELVAVAGLVGIVGSAVLLTSDSPFPGYNALGPCLGSAALIHANTASPTLSGRLLGSRPFVWVGLISYSLYLVHWPLIVFTGYVLLRPMTAVEDVALFAAMLALAELSWRFVEQPFRNRRKVSRRAILLFSAAGLLLFLGVGAGLFAADGVPQRFPGLKAAGVRNEAREPAGPVCFVKGDFREWAGDACFLARSPGAPVTLLWGDSHANHYRRAIVEAEPKLRANLLLYASAGCLPLLENGGKARAHCKENNQHVLDVIRRYHVTRVVLSGYWEHTLDLNHTPIADVAATVGRLRAMGLDVRVIGDNPDFSFANPQYLAYRLRQRRDPDAPFRIATRNHPAVNAALRSMIGSSRFFDPMDALCRRDGCLIYERGEIMMTDNAHFSLYGAGKVLGRMRWLIER